MDYRFCKKIFTYIKKLTHNTQTENSCEILFSVSCVKTALTDEKGKYGHGKSADIAKKRRLRQKYVADMVNKH